jgi:hypothetical protein
VLSLVAPTPLYRSLVTGEVIEADALVDCEECEPGYVDWDSDELCPECHGTGKVAGYGGFCGDNYLPHRVRRLSEQEAQAHREEVAR